MSKKLSQHSTPVTPNTLQSILQSYHTKHITVYTSVLSHPKNISLHFSPITQKALVDTSVLSHQAHYSLHVSPITQKTLQSMLQSYHTQKNIKVYTSVLSHQTFTIVLFDFGSDISVSITSFHKILSPATC